MKKWICIGLAVMLLLCMSGCSVHTQKTVFAMDTVMDLQVWGRDSEAAIEALSGLITDMDEKWSVQKDSSLISRLNRGEKIEDPLLDRVQALSQRTGGAFDPRLKGVMDLWGFRSKAYHVPSQTEICEAKQLQLWDLGGAVKGYAGQQAAQLLQTMDVGRAVLNLGGNIQTYGQKPDGAPWTIGIQNPDGGDYIGTVAVIGTAAVVTSGDYQRYFEQDGMRYHHILDPDTGKPAQSGLRSVTVICRDGLTADVLSTALFVMGLEQGSALWRQSEDFEAVFVTREGKVYATAGAALSGCEYEVITR